MKLWSSGSLIQERSHKMWLVPMFPCLSLMVLLTLWSLLCPCHLLKQFTACIVDVTFPLFNLRLESVISTACVGQFLLEYTTNHTHTQGTGSYDAFYGITAMCSWIERLKTKKINKKIHKPKEACWSFLFLTCYWVECNCISVFALICVHLSWKCLSP